MRGRELRPRIDLFPEVVGISLVRTEATIHFVAAVPVAGEKVQRGSPSEGI